MPKVDNADRFNLPTPAENRFPMISLFISLLRQEEMALSWWHKAKGVVFPKASPIVNAVHLQGIIAARAGPRGVSYAALESHLGTVKNCFVQPLFHFRR